MKKEKILGELRNELPDLLFSQLNLSLAVPGSIIICATIWEIVEQYNSTPEKEKRVSYLLSCLCKYHFRNPKP